MGKALKPHGLIAQSVPVIVAAMRGQGVRRLVFMSAYGVGETWRDVPVLPRLLMRLFLREIYADKAAGEAELVRSNLDWTLVHPVTLTDGPLTGCYRTGERLNLRGLPRVPRSEVADFLVRQISDRRYLKKSALIST